MNFITMCEINKTIEKYTKKYIIGNNIDTLNVFIQANMNEEAKELFLNDLDTILPLGLFFKHTYENNKLIVEFEEVEIAELEEDNPLTQMLELLYNDE